MTEQTSTTPFVENNGRVYGPHHVEYTARNPKELAARLNQAWEMGRYSVQTAIKRALDVNDESI